MDIFGVEVQFRADRFRAPKSYLATANVSAPLQVESFNQPLAFGTEDPSFPCALGTQHPSPAFGMEGYNMTYVSYDKDEEWKGSYTVVDKLVVPEDLTPGDYVLSFRLVTNKVINLI